MRLHYTFSSWLNSFLRTNSNVPSPQAQRPFFLLQLQFVCFPPYPGLFYCFFNADKIRVRSVLCHHTLLHHTLCHWELLFFVSVCLSYYFWVVTPALFIMQPISRSAHHKAPLSLVSLGGMSRERPSKGIMQADESQWFSSGFVLWFSWVSQSDGRRVAHSLLYWMFEGRLKKQKEIYYSACATPQIWKSGDTGVRVYEKWISNNKAGFCNNHNDTQI